MHKPRVHSDPQGYFLHRYQWDLLIERISLEYGKKLRDPNYAERVTTLIEFSRGSEHGGYRAAFRSLSAGILEKACILYIDVSYEESLRKNRKRFNPNKPDSILEHGLEDAKLDRLYREVDWQEVSASDYKMIPIAGKKVPYVVFDNHDDVTTARGDELGARLEGCLTRLWEYYLKR